MPTHEIAGQRADLDLQISLLSEHEITRLITLVTDIAKHLDVASAEDPELRELAKGRRPRARARQDAGDRADDARSRGLSVERSAAGLNEPV